MVEINNEKIEEIGNLLNDTNRPLKERFRALFTLKNLGGPTAIDAIAKCFADDSALLKHELAYCLGQMQDASAIPHLVKVIDDKSQEPMVRHEAGKYRKLFIMIIIIFNVLPNESCGIYVEICFDLLNNFLRRSVGCHWPSGCCANFGEISTRSSC